MMPVVSISEAARLSGKARSTIQTYIKTGKISKNTDNHTGNTGIEISELIRVFGDISIQNTNNTTCSENSDISHQTTPKSIKTTAINANSTAFEKNELLHLKLENDYLKSVLEAKQETIESLKTALKLLEYRQEKSEPAVAPSPKVEPPPQATPEPVEAPVTETVTVEPTETVTPSPTGFWSGLKNLFK